MRPSPACPEAATYSFIQPRHCLFALVYCIVDILLVSIDGLGDKVEAELINWEVVFSGMVL